MFTPRLVDTYDAISKKEGVQWEIVFVSFDKEPQQFKARAPLAPATAQGGRLYRVSFGAFVAHTLLRGGFLEAWGRRGAHFVGKGRVPPPRSPWL